jgi:hypothetical protein
VTFTYQKKVISAAQCVCAFALYFTLLVTVLLHRVHDNLAGCFGKFPEIITEIRNSCVNIYLLAIHKIQTFCRHIVPIFLVILFCIKNRDPVRIRFGSWSAYGSAKKINAPGP